jgi:outer membrane immunogenic protein
MRVLIATALIFGVATPACAQNFPHFRIEANVGFDSTRGEVSYRDATNPANDFKAHKAIDGVVFGGTIGYDVKVNDVLYVGVEGGVDFADNKRCLEVFGSDAACFSVKRNLAAGVRIGTPLSKASLFYVGAAYVNGKARVSYRDDIDPTNDFAFSDKRDGYRVSAGVEQRITGRFFAKAEYRYSDYSKYHGSVSTGDGTLAFDRHQVVGGVGVRF